MDFYQNFTFPPDTGEFKDRDRSVTLASDFIFTTMWGEKWIMA